MDTGSAIKVKLYHLEINPYVNFTGLHHASNKYDAA